MDLPFSVIGLTQGTELHPAIEGWIHLELELQYKIPIFLFGAEKGVWRLRNSRANNGLIIDAVLGHPAPLNPTVQIFSVEQGNHRLVLGGTKTNSNQKGKAVSSDFMLPSKIDANPS